MTTNQMQCFVTICEYMSFTKAAQALYITQPAISRQISALEKELNTRLLDRKPSGEIALTFSGQKYLPLFQRSLQELNRISLQLQHSEKYEKIHYTIGIVENWVIPEKLKFCRETLLKMHPEIHLDFVFLPFGALNTQRQNGTLDFVMTVQNALTEATGYTAKDAGQIHPMLVFARNHPQADAERLDFSALRQEPYYILNASEMYDAKSPSVLLNMDGQIPRWIECASLPTINAHLLSGSGYTVYDEWSAERYSSLFSHRIMEDSLVQIAVSWKKGYMEEIAQAVFDCLKNT